MNCVSCDIWVYHLGLFVFFRRVFLSSRVTGACPVTTDLIMRVNVRTTTTTTTQNSVVSKREVVCSSQHNLTNLMLHFLHCDRPPQAFQNMKASSRRLLGGEPEEKTTLQEMEEAVCGVCPSLSWRHRIIGYGTCLAVGCILTFGSLFRFVFVVTKTSIVCLVYVRTYV